VLPDELGEPMLPDTDFRALNQVAAILS
jgi:hypothetical protein